MINFIFSLLPKYSILNFYLIDSFRNDDDFLAALLVMGIIFFILAIIIGIALVLIFFATLLVLIGVGLISASVLVGLQQKSLSKGFKTLFLSSSILGTTIISVIFFWFLNRIEDWWSNDVSIFAGIAVGFLSGWILGIIIFTAAKKMVLFLKNKYDQKFNRKINETTNDLVDFKNEK